MVRIQLYGGRFDGQVANIASGEEPPDDYRIKSDNGVEHYYVLFTYSDGDILRFEYRFKEAVYDKS